MSDSRRNLSAMTEFLKTDAVPMYLSVLLTVAIVLDMSNVYRRVPRKIEVAAATMPWALPISHRFDVSRVIAGHLFGVAPNAETQAQAAAKMKLTGTIVWEDDQSRGYAFLGPSERLTKVFTPGMELPDGSTVERIMHNQVVLATAGARLAVFLPKTVHGLPNAGMPAVEQMVAAAEAAPAPSAASAAPDEVSRARSWFNGFDAEPSGDHSGYVLHPMPRYKRQYGLHDGDVVTRINGVAMDGPDAAAQELQRFSGSTVSMTVVRDGVPIDVSLSMN